MIVLLYFANQNCYLNKNCINKNKFIKFLYEKKCCLKIFFINIKIVKKSFIKLKLLFKTIFIKTKICMKIKCIPIKNYFITIVRKIIYGQCTEYMHKKTWEFIVVG